jgi:hypothetical protein
MMLDEPLWGRPIAAHDIQTIVADFATADRRPDK